MNPEIFGLIVVIIGLLGLSGVILLAIMRDKRR